jgi:hypothetical protein
MYPEPASCDPVGARPNGWGLLFLARGDVLCCVTCMFPVLSRLPLGGGRAAWASEHPNDDPKGGSAHVASLTTRVAVLLAPRCQWCTDRPRAAEPGNPGGGRTERRTHSCCIV